MNIDDRKAVIDDLLNIITLAGESIMEIYIEDAFDVQYKEDNSPLTKADKASHEVIVKGLQLLTPAIPILSEESRSISYEERKTWSQFWCVDPLDGTKEFIKKNGEFAINLALIENQKPVLGIIYAPVTKTIYYATDGCGCWKKEASFQPVLLENKTMKQEIVAVGSRSHAHAGEQEILEQFQVTDFISIGSALKFCMIAEGKAQVYCRFGATMEWDTAAGHAILNNSQCELTQLNGGTFQYNKPELVNPGFICKTKLIKDFYYS